jgi:hypothetical protein
MYRKMISMIKLIAVVVFALGFSIGQFGTAEAFTHNKLKLPGIGGGSSGVNVDDLVGKQSGLVKSATTALINLTKSQSIMADALGLKEQSALAAKTAKDLESGDLGGEDGLKTGVTIAESTQKEIDRVLKENKILDAKSKAKFATSLPPYGKGVVGLISTTQQAASMGQSAMKSPSPAVITKLGSMIFLARKAPSLISTFKNATSNLMAFSQENKIPTDDLKKEIGGIGFG